MPVTVLGSRIRRSARDDRGRRPAPGRRLPGPARPVGSFSAVPASSGGSGSSAVHPRELADADAARARRCPTACRRAGPCRRPAAGRAVGRRCGAGVALGRGPGCRARRGLLPRTGSGSCCRATTCASSGSPLAAASARVVKLLAAAIDHRVSPGCTVCGAPATARCGRNEKAPPAMRAPRVCTGLSPVRPPCGSLTSRRRCVPRRIARHGGFERGLDGCARANRPRTTNTYV